MADTDPAQIEAAADAAAAAYMREYDRADLWHRVARAALTAAAQVQPALRVSAGGRAYEQSAQVQAETRLSPGDSLESCETEADEREALAEKVRGVMSRCQIDGVDPAREIADVLRSQPAPRTVTAEAQIAEDVVAALLLALHDAHPSYGNTSGWRGGIGGSVITQGCSIIDPPPGADWTQYDLLSEPARRYIVAHPEFDLASAKERVKASALAALGITVEAPRD